MRNVNVGLAAASLALAGSLVAAGARADENRELRKVLPLDGRGTLSVENYKGSITVTTGTAAEASVEAKIVPDGDDEASLRRARETDVRVDGGGGSVSVRTIQPKSHHGNWFGLGGDGSLPFVHYTIRMPATASLKIDDYKSDTKLTGLKADLRVRTYKGTVAVWDQDGAVDLETYKGEVSIAFGALAKPVTLETYKGDIRLKLPSSAGFEMDADLGRRGDFDTQFDMATRSGGKQGRIHGTINGGGPKISFETDKGSLRLEKE
jgi:hypothetical protein